MEQCEKARSVIGIEFDGVDSEALQKEAAEHVSDCRSCQIWQRQIADIIDVGRTLPSFDVSERLTQNILSRVAEEEKGKQRQMTWILYTIGVTVFMWLLIVVDAYESIWGVGSWLVGLAAMFAIKALVCEEGVKRQSV